MEALVREKDAIKSLRGCQITRGAVLLDLVAGEPVRCPKLVHNAVVAFVHVLVQVLHAVDAGRNLDVDVAIEHGKQRRVVRHNPAVVYRYTRAIRCAWSVTGFAAVTDGGPLIGGVAVSGV